jgi:hypothetical protein
VEVIKFVDELPGKTRSTGLQAEMQNIVDLLKSRPGQWALVFDTDDNLSQQTASNRAAAFKKFEDVDATSRTVKLDDGSQVGTVYAVFNGEEGTA